MGLRPLAQDVFEHFPHGILVFARSGALIGANKATGRLLGPLKRKPDGSTPRCCDLFGCRTPGALDGVCLAELAATEGPLPDIRLDLSPPAPAAAVWLSPAPFGGNGENFLVELRAADARDRRRRTQRQWAGEARLRVFALGRTRLESAVGPIETRWLEQRAGELFKYLICERRRVVYPDEVAAAIWPNEDGNARGNVRYFVHRLRRHLEPEPPEHGPSSFIIAVDGGYRLAPSIHVDADEFERYARVGFAARSRGQLETAAEQLERALGLYGGDLIADQPNAAWAFDERERLRALAEDALRHLLQIDLTNGHLDAALGRLRRLVQLEPFDLDMHRQLLTVCLKRGRRSEALRRYVVLKSRLREEFNEELDFDLTDLASGDALSTYDHPPAGKSPSGASTERRR